MKKYNFSIPKDSMSILNLSKFQKGLISKKAQSKIKGGSGDSIIIEEDMVI